MSGVPVEVCANCGMESGYAVKLKNCNACRLVKYCGVDCQRAHRKRHKAACKKRAAELKDEQLYGQGRERPEGDFCPICTLPIPLPMGKHSVTQICCMKVICNGCFVAEELQGRNSTGPFSGSFPTDCPFCRAPSYEDNESALAMIQKRIDAGDADAMEYLGIHYLNGVQYGLKKDVQKAMKLLTDAAELGSLDAHFEVGNLYHFGDGVEKDEARVVEHWEKAAMQGHAEARHNLGVVAAHKENHQVAMKHYMISAKLGYKESLDNIKTMFMYGYATNDQYAEALKGYGDAVEEMKSHHREQANAVINFACSNIA